MADFTAAVTTASVYTTPCTSLRKGGYVVIQGRPCRIDSLSTSTGGKMGRYARIHLVGHDIFTFKKLEIIAPLGGQMEVPIVDKVDYTVIDIDGTGDTLTLKDGGGSVRNDVRLPKGDFGQQIKKLFNPQVGVLVVGVSKTMGKEGVTGYEFEFW